MAKGKQRTAKVHKKAKTTPRQRHQQNPRNANTKRTRNIHSTNAAKIEEYMTSHGVIRVPIIGDGNCLFRALADQIGLSQDSHRQIRDKIVDVILRDKDYFINFIDEDEIDGVDAYCEEMSKDGVWGDDIELEAFRRAFERALVIYDASTGTPYIKPFNGDEGKSLSTVHLWKSDCHYESVRNKDGPFDGPSRVVYKDVKMSAEDVERIKREHEDVIVEEVKMALPNIHVNEIRRFVKKYGDGNKVLELLSGESTNDIDHQNPLEQPISDPISNGTLNNTGSLVVEGADLTRSIEMLSLDNHPDVNLSPPRTPPLSPAELDPVKTKSRQRRQVSTARKQKQAKREQKEAAKRRKRMEVLGIDTAQENESNLAQGHILKAIVI